MKTIHKYAVEPGAFTLRLPRGAKFLCVQTQSGHPQSWWLVDTEPRRFGPANAAIEDEEREFVTYGTGHTIREHDEDATYLGTFQVTEMDDNWQNHNMVFHLFERTR